VPAAKVKPSVVAQARSFHAEVIRADDAALRELADSWRKVRDDLIRREREFLANLIEKHGLPLRLTPNQLYRESRFRSLIAQAEQQVTGWANDAHAMVSDSRSQAFRLAIEHADEYARLSGFTGMQAVPSVTDPAFLERVLGRTRTDAVGALFDRFGTDVAGQMRDLLITGVGSARHPLAVARDLARATDMPGWQAARISRTEMMSAYRGGSLDSWRTSPVIEGWVWMTAQDHRVCPVCRAMSGTEHRMEEEFGTHPACRCVPVPKTFQWGDLLGSDYAGIAESVDAVPDGEAAFAALSSSERKAVLGPGRNTLYDSGTPLRDMVRTTDSPVWGQGRELIPLYQM